MRASLLLTIVVAATAMLSTCGRTDTVNSPSAIGPGQGLGPDNRGPVPPPSPTPPSSGTCDATQAQFAVGQVASNDLLERARIAAGAGSARFLRPNQPITTEFLGSRLNLNLNDRDIVNGVTCG